jgi:adenylylsulfate kinase
MTEHLVESRRKSLAKGITWRAIATGTTVTIAYLITGEVDQALQIGFIEVFAKIAIYYLHERAWARVSF